MKDMLRRLDEVSRRQFVQYAAKTCLGVGVLGVVGRPAAALAAGAGQAKNVIYLYMGGGMSHLDTFDPKPGTDVQGETQAISTNVDGIQISGYLPNLAKQMDKIAVVRSMNSRQGAHERANYLMHTSYNPLATTRHPAMGSWVVKMQGRINNKLPGFVLVGGGSRHPGAGFMDGQYAPLPIGDPNQGLKNSSLPNGVDEQQFSTRLKLADALDRNFRRKYEGVKSVKAYTDFYRESMQLMYSDDVKAFDLNQENQQVRQRYGMDRFGQGCLLARRLVEHGVRFVEVQLNSWDNHYDIFTRIPDNCETLDTALSALIQDLDSKGLLKNTLIALGTDFGRTPNINERAGRDHHPRVFSCILAGGGIKGGQVYGRSDNKAYAVEESGVAVEDFNATIAMALGLELEQKLVSPDGRPFKVAHDGKPVTALF